MEDMDCFIQEMVQTRLNPTAKVRAIVGRVINKNNPRENQIRFTLRYNRQCLKDYRCGVLQETRETTPIHLKQPMLISLSHEQKILTVSFII